MCEGFSGLAMATWRLSAGARLFVFPGIRKRIPLGFVVTFNAYKAAFQVIGHFTKGDMELSGNETGLRSALVQIWPNHGEDVQWPLPRIFPQKALKSLATSVVTSPPPKR